MLSFCELILHYFSHSAIRRVLRSSAKRVFFLKITNYEEMLKVRYCQPVDQCESGREAQTMALSDLLDGIVNDENMPIKVKQKRLKQVGLETVLFSA